MDDALRVNDHLDLLVGQAEEPVRLYDLQALVHQGGGVYRYFRPHPPGGMRQRLLDRDGAHLFGRKAAERPTGGGQDEAAHLAGLLPAQALPDGAVLAIHRQDRDAVVARGLHDEVAGHHQRLLVGQRDGFPGANGGQRGPQPHQAGCSGYDDIDIGMRGNGEQPVFTEQHAGQRRARGTFRSGCVGEARDEGRVKFLSLLREQFHIAARGQGHHLKVFREAAHDIERLLPNRAGAAEYCDTPGEAGAGHVFLSMMCINIRYHNEWANECVLTNVVRPCYACSARAGASGRVATVDC